MKAVVFPGDRKVQIRDFPDPTPGPGRGRAGDQGLGHVRQRPQVLPRRRRRRVARVQDQQRSGDRGTRALRRGGRGRPGRSREAGARRHARHAAPLPRLRRLRALLDRLDAAVRGRRSRGVRRHRPRRACPLHEMPGTHAGAAARRAVLRGRRGDLVRHRNRVGRAASARPAGRPHHRDLRPGPGRPVGNASSRRRWARA